MLHHGSICLVTMKSFISKIPQCFWILVYIGQEKNPQNIMFIRLSYQTSLGMKIHTMKSSYKIVQSVYLAICEHISPSLHIASQSDFTLEILALLRSIGILLLTSMGPGFNSLLRGLLPTAQSSTGLVLPNIEFTSPSVTTASLDQCIFLYQCLC